MILYNNASLISKASEETASKNAENCRFQQPHCHLMPPIEGTPVNICINLILPETTVSVLHLHCQ